MTLQITHGHLTPCPCNGQRPDETFAAPPEVHMITCPNCGAFFAGDTAEEAEAAWNRAARAKAEEAIVPVKAWLWCPSCGRIDGGHWSGCPDEWFNSAGNAGAAA